MADSLPLLSREAQNAPRYPEKILQFGTGNFLKGFTNWIVQKLNDGNGFDAGIVAIKLRRGNEIQVDRINAQDGLFTLNIRGMDQGQLVDEFELIRCQNRALSPYREFSDFIALADNPDLEWVVSNTTEAGIRFDENDSPEDTPPESFPAKLTQLLFRRYRTFSGDPDKGLQNYLRSLNS